MNTENIKKRLAEAQSKNIKRSALDAYRKDIEESYKRGISIRAIHKILKDEGYNGSVTTLGAVIESWGIKRKQTKKKKTNADVIPPTQTPEKLNITVSSDFADKASSYDNDDV